MLSNLLLIFSCTDPCDNVYCVAGQGECFDGDCLCLVQSDTLPNGDVVTTYWGGDSCNIDLCQNLPCVNGDCIFGICECSPGFAGDSCGYLLRGPYIDTFIVDETCIVDSVNVAANYNTIILADTTNQEFVYIHNFYLDSTATPIRARATEFGLEIDPSPQQITVGSETYEIAGTSTSYDSLSFTMNFVYTLTSNSNVFSCSSLLIKP